MPTPEVRYVDPPPHDWDNWRDCLTWLLEVYSSPELAELLGVAEATAYGWRQGTEPEPPARRDLLYLARLFRGRLQGIEARGYQLEALEPTITPQFDTPPEGPLVDEQGEPIDPADAQGLPTGSKRAAINQRLRELAARRHGGGDDGDD